MHRNSSNTSCSSSCIVAEVCVVIVVAVLAEVSIVIVVAIVAEERLPIPNTWLFICHQFETVKDSSISTTLYYS